MLRAIRSIGLVACACVATAHAMTIAPELKGTARRAIGQMVDCNYATAFRIADSLVAADASEPLGYVLRMFTYGLRILDYNEFIDSAGLMDTYRQTAAIVAAYEIKHGRTSYSLTMGGFAQATHASFYLQQKKYFSAIGSGLDALDLFSQAKKIDLLNYDVDFFLGMYDYAKSELKKKLWMVMFWAPGDKTAGRKRLEACGRWAEISNDAAFLALMDIYVQESKFSQAIGLIDSLSQRYPASRFILWSKAKYFEAQKDYMHAGEVFDQLASSYEKDRQGAYNALNCRYRQMECLQRTGRRVEAVSVGQAALNCCSGPQKRRYADVCRKIEGLIKRDPE
jgi:tetratricopeptide (TPR) repeat protein